MAIFKEEIIDEFVKIPNETIQDPDMTAEAKGVLVLLLSMPSGWAVHRSWLIQQFKGCKKDKMTRILKELVEKGYMKKRIQRLDNGRVNGCDWSVYPRPKKDTAQPEAEKPEAVKPDAGKAVSIKKQYYKETYNINTMSDSNDSNGMCSKPSFQNEELIIEGFNIFWVSGMRKDGKKKALSIFTKLCKKGKLNPIEFGNTLSNDVILRLHNKQFGFDNTLPASYLNGERWNDEHKANTEYSTYDNKLSASERITQANNQRYVQQGGSGLGLAEDGRHISRSLDTRAGEGTIERMDTVTIESWDD